MRDHKVTDMNDVLKAVLLSNDVVFEDEEKVTIVGTEVIVDFTGFGWSHAAQVTVPIAKKAATVMQVMFPLLLAFGMPSS